MHRGQTYKLTFKNTMNCKHTRKNFSGSQPARFAASSPRSAYRGFTLMELLAVIAIMLILLQAAAVLFRSPISKAAEPAARISRSIALARATAVASNSKVILRFGQETAGLNGELVVRFYKIRTGLTAKEDLEEFRRAEHFPNIDLAELPGLTENSGGGASPGESPSFLALDESLVFTADGQVMRGTGETGVPATNEQLENGISIGVQPTVAGIVVKSVEEDVAMVKIQCATGTSRVIKP